MNLSHRQLAKLRELGRQGYELELRGDARRAARMTQVDYIATLRRQQERLPRDRDVQLRAAETDAQHAGLRKRFDADEKRITGELETAQKELEQLHAQIAEITAFSSPLREVIDRVLSAAHLHAADAGLNFGADFGSHPGAVITIGGGR